VKLPQNPKVILALFGALLLLAFLSGRLFWSSPAPALAQDNPDTAVPAAIAQTPAPDAADTNAPAQPPPSETSTNAVAAIPGTESLEEATPAAAPAPGEGPTPGEPLPAGIPGTPGSPTTASPAVTPPSPPNGNTNEIQLSFQGANIDTVVQWLAKTTGKSVVKHKAVQCQLTIVSSKNLPPRDAVNLVYRALSLEGFTTIETSQSILIVPEGQEPKLSPELMEQSRTELPEGRQRLLRVFNVEHIPASELREKVKSILSDKAIIEADDRGNKLVVTDYTENIRLLGELIPEFDIISSSETRIEIFPLTYSEAEELANLLNLVLNDRPGTPSPNPSPAGRPSPGTPMMVSGPGGPSPGGSPPGGAAATANQQVRLWPDKTSNRLIVSAPRSRMPEVQEIIQILDTEKPADVAVRVLPLRHVNAENLVREIGPLYQKMSGRSLKDMIEVTANQRSNSLIILSSESNFRGIERLVHSLDTSDAQEKILQSFALKNADAEDVAKQLQDLNKDQGSTSRMIYYWPPRPTTDTKMSVVADRRRNTVIVQASPAEMQGIAKMIESLDEPVTDDGLAPKIFPLKFVNALDIEDVLNELFLKKQPAQRSYWDYYYTDSQQSTSEAGRLYGKVRITSEAYSNSLIVTSNSAENLEAVEQVLKQLDVPSQAGETTLRVDLKFAQSVQIATSMNVLFARGGSPALRGNPQQPQPGEQTGQRQGGSSSRVFALEQQLKEDAYFPWLGGQQENFRSGDGRNAIRPVSDLVGRVRVVPDRRSNSLLITSNVHFLPQIIKLVNELDTATPQIMIEARIVEVSTDFRDRLGVRWSPDGRQIFDADDFDNSLMPSVGAAYTETFIGSRLADSFRTGVLDARINLDFLVQFLRKNTDATVLAEPKINVSDNEMGRLFVGAQVPFITATTFTPQGGRNDSFEYRDVGITLEVTPHINNSDEVAMKIRTESSNMRVGQVLLGGAILDTRNFETDLLVRSGQTIVLGGILQREDLETVRKVPVLGSIPGLGWAFKKRDKLNREVELIVFLRPVITRSAEEAADMVRAIERRSPKLKELNDATVIEPVEQH
jgi:type II secretion system protein D